MVKLGRRSTSRISINSESSIGASLTSSISAHADWMSHPGTEKALDYLFLLNGLDKDGKLRPKELLVDGKTLPVKDLTKGQIYALM